MKTFRVKMMNDKSFFVIKVSEIFLSWYQYVSSYTFVKILTMQNGIIMLSIDPLYNVFFWQLVDNSRLHYKYLNFSGNSIYKTHCFISVIILN